MRNEIFWGVLGKLETHHREVPRKTLRLEGQNMSFRGCLTLIKSVLSNFPTYYLSLFVAPSSVISQLEKLRLNFLWGGSKDNRKISWVSWSKITKAREYGGLGVGLMGDLNIALICKWWWRLKMKK
uniref:Uncharacterized protein n=1 Tax=Lactuca sativa TaxID=4236 RepID=A0A9R1VSF2_LACSA|nr:hypothetical protein LSAT_V11C400228290 [Lactuca sativa]